MSQLLLCAKIGGTNFATVKFYHKIQLILLKNKLLYTFILNNIFNPIEEIRTPQPIFLRRNACVSHSSNFLLDFREMNIHANI
jgi:hypothetical protein